MEVEASGVKLPEGRLTLQKTSVGQWGELEHQKTVVELVLPLVVQKIEVGAVVLAAMVLAADSRDFQRVLPGRVRHFQREALALVA